MPLKAKKKKLQATENASLCQRCAAPAAVNARNQEGVPLRLCHHCAEHLRSKIQLTPFKLPSETILPARQCSACGYTLEMFETTHHLGCPSCYSVFEGQIAQLING